MEGPVPPLVPEKLGNWVLENDFSFSSPFLLSTMGFRRSGPGTSFLSCAFAKGRRRRRLGVEKIEQRGSPSGRKKMGGVLEGASSHNQGERKTGDFSVKSKKKRGPSRSQMATPAEAGLRKC